MENYQKQNKLLYTNMNKSHRNKVRYKSHNTIYARFKNRREEEQEEQ